MSAALNLEILFKGKLTKQSRVHFLTCFGAFDPISQSSSAEGVVLEPSVVLVCD